MVSEYRICSNKRLFRLNAHPNRARWLINAQSRLNAHEHVLYDYLWHYTTLVLWHPKRITSLTVNDRCPDSFKNMMPSNHAISCPR